MQRLQFIFLCNCLLALVWAVSGCGGDNDDKNSTTECNLVCEGNECDEAITCWTPPYDMPPKTMNCRPVDLPWDPATQPLLLPCEMTKEVCDGVDNDNDGFTDPHCGTMPCTSDADCTYDGLLPDADCNHYPMFSDSLDKLLAGGICNQIDGVPGGGDHEKCWGMLCPPGQKCTQGECIEPGAGLPGSSCTSGADCPINSGCIPQSGHHTDSGPNRASDLGRCVTYCHEYSCPDGYSCTKESEDKGEEHTSATCESDEEESDEEKSDEEKSDEDGK